LPQNQQDIVEEATKALMQADKNSIVYQTNNERIVIEVQKSTELRGLVS